MAISSFLRYSLLLLALVGVLALGVNSCAAPEETETKTDAAATTTSTDGGSSDNGTTTSDDASVAALIWDQGNWNSHNWQ